MPSGSGRRADGVGVLRGVGTVQELVRKLRIVVLWIFLAVGMTTGMVLYLAEPGMLRDVLQGRIEGSNISAGQLIMFASFTVLPLVMAYLTLVLAPAANKWSNLVLGAAFTLSWAFDLISHLGGYFGGEAFVVVFGIVAGALIVWEAWRWPITAAAPTVPRDRQAVH